MGDSEAPAGTKRPADDAGSADGTVAKAAKPNDEEEAVDCTVKLEPCVVCREKRYYPASFVPCGHVLCDACATVILAKEKKECHLCRGVVTAVVPNIPLAQALGFKIVSDRAPPVVPGPSFEFVEDRLYVVLKKSAPCSELSVAVARKGSSDNTIELYFTRFGYVYGPGGPDVPNASYYTLSVSDNVFAYKETISLPKKVKCSRDHKPGSSIGHGCHGDYLFYMVAKDEEIDVTVFRGHGQNACIRLYTKKKEQNHCIALPGPNAVISD